MAAYVEIDHIDRHYFESALRSDIERLAFISYFVHVENDFPYKKRPRTGKGRVKLWNKSPRTHWIHRAQATVPFPQIQQQAAPAAAAPLLPSAPPQPPPLTLTVPIPAATIHISPVVGVKRTREETQGAEELAPDEPPAKRRLPRIGGERWPSFVLHSDTKQHGEIRADDRSMPPTREQREHIQEHLGGNWRFAKTLSQVNTIQGARRWGFPKSSVFLFVELDDAGIIQDQVAVKCTDVSRDDETFAKDCTNREDTVRQAFEGIECSHLPQYRRPSKQTGNFSIEAGNPNNKDPSLWALRYIYTRYEPHGNISELITNHQKAKQLIPEHFIWMVLQGLVHALMVCQTGHCSEHRAEKINDYAEDWRSILHLDINPSNILFGVADAKYPYYKTPILADFDTAIRLNPDSVRQKTQCEEVRHCGWQDWQAPEQHRSTQKQYPPKNWPLDHATDIYSLGLLIRHMMCHAVPNFDKVQKNEAAKFFSKAKDQMKENLVEFPWHCYPSIYSLGLIKVVEGCLAFQSRVDPNDPTRRSRFSLFQLRDRISAALDTLDATFGGAFETAQKEFGHPLHVHVPKEDDRFKLGSQFNLDSHQDVMDFVYHNTDDIIRDEARHEFEAYHGIDHSMPLSEDSKLAKLPTPALPAMQKAMDDTFATLRQNTLANSTGSERETNLLTLEHAAVTIRKCINPHGTFKQHHGYKDPAFIDPKRKLQILESFQQECMNKTQEKKLELDAKSIDFEAIGTKIASMSDQTDQARAEKEAMQAVLEQAQNSIARSQSEIDAFSLLREAAGFGMLLFELGKDADFNEDTYDERWARVLSNAHRGTWEYFWSIPDGVQKAV